MGFFSRWFNRKEASMSKPIQHTVTFDDEQILHVLADGRQEKVSWAELQNVVIVTTNGGPFLEEVFWVLSGENAGCLIPSSADGMGELLTRLQQLPDFDNEAVIAAMSSVENEKFPCWQRDEPSLQ